MATAKVKTPPSTGIRFTEDDRRLMDKLRKKLGVDLTQVVRISLRALAEKEGLTA